MSVAILVGELDEVRTQARAILSEWDGKLSEMPAEAKTKLQTLMEKASELKPKLEVEHDLEQKSKQLATLDDYMSSPQYKVPRGPVNSDDDGRKSLLAAGWEIKSGMVYAPTSAGLQPMYGEDVLFGELPTNDQAAAQYFRQTRSAMQPEYKTVFHKWFSKACQVKNENLAFTLLEPAEQKALAEGIDTAGGYLVPPDMQAEILVRLPQNAVMRKLCMVRQTSRDLLRFPRVLPNAGSLGNQGAGADSIYTSGFVGGWAGETPAFSDTDPGFGFFDVPVRKVRVATRLSNDFLADAITNPLTFLSTDGAKNMALVEDQGFIAGIGDALRPLGVAAAPISGVDITGTTAHTISNTTAALGSASKIMNMQYQVPSQYQATAQWLMHRLSENDIRQLVNGLGAFLWAPGFDSPQPNLLGKPINRSDFVIHPANAGDIGLVYGDFSAYVIAERAQISVTILRERFADTDQTGIILWERVGGNVWNTDAFRLGTVT